MGQVSISVFVRQPQESRLQCVDDNGKVSLKPRIILLPEFPSGLGDHQLAIQIDYEDTAGETPMADRVVAEQQFAILLTLWFRGWSPLSNPMQSDSVAVSWGVSHGKRLRQKLFESFRPEKLTTSISSTTQQELPKCCRFRCNGAPCRVH